MNELLDVKQVAEELNIPNNLLPVMRLIARGRLKAARMGGTGAWRVTTCRHTSAEVPKTTAS